MKATIQEVETINRLVDEIGIKLMPDHNPLIVENVLADLTAWWLVALTPDMEQRKEALKHFVNQVIDFAAVNDQLNETKGSA